LVIKNLQVSATQSRTLTKTLSAFDQCRPGTFERPFGGVLTSAQFSASFGSQLRGDLTQFEKF
jgi:hypothetical protein